MPHRILNVFENFDNFKVSWGSSFLLVFGSEYAQQFLPVIIQITLVLSLQIIAVGVDLIRTKYKLKPRVKQDSELPKDKDSEV